MSVFIGEAALRCLVGHGGIPVTLSPNILMLSCMHHAKVGNCQPRMLNYGSARAIQWGFHEICVNHRALGGSTVRSVCTSGCSGVVWLGTTCFCGSAKLPTRRGAALVLGLMPSRSHRIDDKLDRLMARAKELQVDTEMRDLEDQMPLSPVARIAHPHRPPPRWSEKAAHSAAQAAAEAAAQRAVAAEAESRQRAAAAQSAAAAAAAAEFAAGAALEEAHAASSAAAARRSAAVGTRRRPPAQATVGSGADEPAAEALKRHMEGGDWVCAARVAVAQRVEARWLSWCRHSSWSRHSCWGLLSWRPPRMGPPGASCWVALRTQVGAPEPLGPPTLGLCGATVSACLGSRVSRLSAHQVAMAIQQTLQQPATGTWPGDPAPPAACDEAATALAISTLAAEAAAAAPVRASTPAPKPTAEPAAAVEPEPAPVEPERRRNSARAWAREDAHERVKARVYGGGGAGVGGPPPPPTPAPSFLGASQRAITAEASRLGASSGHEHAYDHPPLTFGSHLPKMGRPQRRGGGGGGSAALLPTGGGSGGGGSGGGGSGGGGGGGNGDGGGGFGASEAEAADARLFAWHTGGKAAFEADKATEG